MDDNTKTTLSGEESGRKGRWADKQYSKQLIAYIDQSCGEHEIAVYNSFFNELAEVNNIVAPQDVMLLDLVVFDFIRLKRLQKVILEEGDVVKFTLRNGKTITKASEASYLHNAIETQLRNNMRELMMTKKEVTKKQLGMEAQDFASWISDNTIDVTAEEEKGVSGKPQAEPASSPHSPV